jgi:NAD(P)-dependent dehydrogenase (short-subunit alcohol dehydrogenase family)
MSPGAVAITGAARGIGFATARVLAGRGYRVAIGDLDDGAAAAAAARIGAGSVGLRLDVTDPASTEAFIAAAERELGPLEAAVANAGVMFVGPFLDEDIDATRLQFDVNVIGVINTLRAAATAMRPRGRGNLVVVASAASWIAPPGEATYAATKHAVQGLARGVRTELARDGITVSLVYPGVVDTELAAGTAPGRTKLLTAERVGTALADVVEHPRAETFVPPELTVAARLWASLPARAAGAFSKLIGVESVTAGTTAAARAAYEERVRKGAGTPGR